MKTKTFFFINKLYFETFYNVCPQGDGTMFNQLQIP